MKRMFVSLALLSMLSAPALATEPLPFGWGGGDKVQGYVLETEPQEKFEGNPVLVIRSTPNTPPDGHVAIGTSFLAEQYRGKRVRFSAFLKSADLEKWSWGGIYMAMKTQMQPRTETYLRYDNMIHRPVKGTTSWTRYEVVLDVPEETDYISMGFHLTRGGTLWMSRPSLEIVAPNVPVTRAAAGIPVDLPREPQLDLGKRQ